MQTIPDELHGSTLASGFASGFGSGLRVYRLGLKVASFEEMSQG